MAALYLRDESEVSRMGPLGTGWCNSMTTLPSCTICYENVGIIVMNGVWHICVNKYGRLDYGTPRDRRLQNDY